MRALMGAALAAALLPGAALAGPAGDALPAILYAGSGAEHRADYASQCTADAADACFGLGLIDFIAAYEHLAQAFYRHGATAPNLPVAAMLLGTGMDLPSKPANPDPEPLTYQGMRDILEGFVSDLDTARASFEQAGAAGDFVITIDPLRVRLDLDGDGSVGNTETLASLLGEALELPAGKTKGNKTSRPETSVGFDTADAFWFAGYSQVAALPADMLLAHDFSAFFDAVGHRLFPEAGLPMQDYSRGGTLVIDPETDTSIADIVAAIHTADFPVIDRARFQGVLARMQAVTALSRRNWQAILAETDDNRELVPSPTQTSIVPDHAVTEDTVAAWMATLDTVDRILAGDLLLPHWRFRQGFDLKAFFDTATETDLVLLLTGQGALPYLRDGPIADARSFAEGNRVFGDRWPNFALWFN